MKMDSLFFELIQVALGERMCISKVPTEEEWNVLYRMAVKQSVAGLAFYAISRLCEVDGALKPPSMLFKQWYVVSVAIGEQNKKLNEAAGLLTRVFASKGLRTCVLKGQGIARLYPDPNIRQSGDIDLWVEGKRDDTIKFLKESHFNVGKPVIHHVDCTIIDGIATEIHFMPGYIYNPFLHHRLQSFFRHHAEQQFSNYDPKLGFAYPTSRFNAVYSLSHIYMHFLYEGIGLRQMIDYYYIIKHLTQEEKQVAIKDIKNVGLSHIAGAVMYVLHEVCGMPEDELLGKVDVRRGRLLLKEIVSGGNFGHSNTLMVQTHNAGMITRNKVRLQRDFTFFRYYPVDVISIPLWKCWHWCWRKYKGYL